MVVLPCCGVPSWMGHHKLPLQIVTEVMTDDSVWVVLEDGVRPAWEWVQVWILGGDGVDDWTLWRLVGRV